MKTLKFKPHLVGMILDGSKTVTWRLFDDKDLKFGDRLELLNSETGEKFAEAEITNVKEKMLKEIEETDYAGHEPFQNEEDMIAHYREYYGPEVSGESTVKIISFKLL